MKHLILYAPSKISQVEVEFKGKNIESTLEAVVPDMQVSLKYFWEINKHKEYSVWYAYVDNDELKKLEEFKEYKFWHGDSAKEAWKAAYKSGLSDAIEFVEQNIKVPIKVLDVELGKEVDKYVAVTEAKSLGKVVDVDAEFRKSGDAILPRKVFDGSK